VLAKSDEEEQEIAAMEGMAESVLQTQLFPQ
jgi:hypothetical protein